MQKLAERPKIFSLQNAFIDFKMNILYFTNCRTLPIDRAAEEWGYIREKCPLAVDTGTHESWEAFLLGLASSVPGLHNQTVKIECSMDNNSSRTNGNDRIRSIFLELSVHYHGSEFVPHGSGSFLVLRVLFLAVRVRSSCFEFCSSRFKSVPQFPRRAKFSFLSQLH